MQLILGGLMTRPPFPEGLNSARKLGVGETLAELPPAALREYVRPWYDSVHLRPGLRGVLLHDGLPDEFTGPYGTDQVRFERVAVGQPCHAYDRRFFAALAWLEAHPEVERWLMLDVNDVALLEDPFAWWDGLGLGRDVLVVGEEWHALRESQWFRGGMRWMPEDYERYLIYEVGHHAPLNCGVWGGWRAAGLEALRAFTAELRRFGEPYAARGEWPGVLADMFAFNVALGRRFAGRVATFKMEYRHEGVTLRGHGSPLQHDRSSALRLLAGR
jgi:hypothetical protein